MAIRFKASTVANGTMATFHGEYESGDYVDFVAYLRGMYGKRLRAGKDSETKATYRNGGDYMTTVELQDLSWSDMEDSIMDQFIHTWEIRPVEIRTLDEITPGGLWWAFNHRRDDLAPFTFRLMDGEDVLRTNICMDCAGAFEEWAHQKRWTLGLQPVPGEYTCSMCLKDIGAKSP